ncbi:ArdC family protein [Nevskia ramosa]|uniref:ArdC family protein n=1 Tax=Nevskia ramosa TaxID=64002 RepID=UPI002357615D|nr:zincin-like metallopeptidase domain-containing protein [Nevskia ramosa]
MSFKTREQIVENLISQVSTMSPDAWKKMWLTLGRTIPVSAITGKPYRGGNRWMLLMKQSLLGYPTGRWLTKKQVLAAGGRIKESEFRKDVLCEFWQRTTSKKKDDNTPSDDDKKLRSRLMVRPFWLYNVDQCEDLPDDILNGPVATLEPVNVRFERAETIVNATGATIIVGDDRAFYRMSDDAIRMPSPEQFLGETAEVKMARYTATLLHELGHWTGHPSRLNRLTLAAFGTPDYAREELVAEFASAILCAELGIQMDELQHPEYLANWLNVVKEDPAALLKGANAAEAAVAHIYRYSKPTEAEAPAADVDAEPAEALPKAA